MDKILGDFVNYIIKTLLEFTGVTKVWLEIGNGDLAIMQEIWDYFILAGLGMSIVYFILELNRKWAFEGQSLTLKSFFVPFLKLVFSVALMSQAAKLFGAFASFNNAFVDFADGFGSAGFTATGGVGEAITSALGFWGKIMLIPILVLTFAVTVLVNLVWAYKGLTYKVEFLARFAFAPIALADIYSGQNANALRYLKGTIALILYGGCLMIIPKMTIQVAISGLSNSFMKFTEVVTAAGEKLGQLVVDDTVLAQAAQAPFDIILGLISVAIAPIAAVGLVSAAKQITKEAIGG